MVLVPLFNVTTEINIKELGIDPTHLSPSPGFGGNLKYKVINNKLMAMLVLGT